jgi:hypothetical protein
VVLTSTPTAKTRVFALCFRQVSAYRLETAQEEQQKGIPVVRGDQPTQGALEHCPVKTQGGLDSWNDLTTAGTPEFINSKAGEILSKSPQQTPSFFFTHIVHAVGHRPHTALTCLPGILLYAPAQDG